MSPDTLALDPKKQNFLLVYLVALAFQVVDDKVTI